MAMPNRSQAIVNNVYSKMTKDLDESVKNSLGEEMASKWKKSNAIHAGEADKIKNTRIKSVLEKGDLTPETVNNMLYSTKPSEVKNLYSSLDQTGKKQARAGIIAKAIEVSKGSPDRFATQLDKMSKHTGIVFKGEDKAFLDGMKEYLNATRRAGSAGVLTPTGQELFQIGAPSALTADILTTGGVGTAGVATFGALSRLYESAPIRDLMLKLKSVPKGSPSYERYIRAISALLAEHQSSSQGEGARTPEVDPNEPLRA
jgi:hypothetical protein